MSDETYFDPSPDDIDVTDPSPDDTPEADTPDTPPVTYAPTVVNPQAYEQIQAGERAQVGQTVDVSQT